MRVDKDKLHEMLRMTLEPEAAIEQATQDCAFFNRMENRWAELHIIPHDSGPHIYLEIGNVLSGGFKECKTQTWTYTQKEDKVIVQKHTHEG